MLDKIKSKLTYILCAAMGALNFIFFALPYVSAFAKYRKQTVKEGVNGYNVMDMDNWSGMDAEFAGTISSLLQIFILIASIGLLVWGVLGILKSCNVFPQFPDKVGNVDSKKIGEYGLRTLSALNMLLLFFLVILCASNTSSGLGITVGLRLSIGIFISLVFSIVAAIAPIVVDKMIPNGIVMNNQPQAQVQEQPQAQAQPETRVIYYCTKCGRGAKETDKFCSACGGAIQSTVTTNEQ